MQDLLWNPVIWWPLLVAVLGGLLVAIGWSFFYGLRSKARIALLWALRAVAVALFLVLLLQPQRRHDEVTVLKPQLAVLIDGSESMTDPVDEQQPRRFERVKEWLASPVVAKAREEFDVRVFTFDQGITERTHEASDMQWKGGRSAVLSAITQTEDRFLGQPLAAVLLLTDGLDTTGVVKPDTAIASRVPIFTFELEKPFKPKAVKKRVSVANVDYPARMVAGWDGEVKVSLLGIGLTGQTVAVELWREGRKRNEASLPFTTDEQTKETVFPVSHEKSGVVQYELRVNDPAADKEARGYPFLIEIIEPGNRILYLQNALGFDFKFLRKAIVADRNLQLSAYVRWADNRLVSISDTGLRGKQTLSLDFTQKYLANYAVVMLGDLAMEAMSPAQLKALRDYADRGGGLVLLGGSHLLASPELARSPLGEVLPVKIGRGADYQEGKFPVEITQTGLHHPVFGPLFSQVKDFPPLLTCNLVDDAMPQAETLMQVFAGGKLRPLVVSMRVGQGRVVAVLTDTIWRWRLASKGWSGEKSPYDTFWAQLMDWLMPKEKKDPSANRIELFTERSNFMLGEKPEVRAIINAPAGAAKLPTTIPLQLRTPEEKVFDYVLKQATLQAGGGREVQGYKVEVEPNVPGIYTAKVALTLGGAGVSGEVRFVVTKPVTEITGKPANREMLARIAETTKGRFYAMGEWDKWRQDIRYTEQRLSRMQLLDLWNNPVLLTLLLGALAAEWICRKLWSLP